MIIFISYLIQNDVPFVAFKFIQLVRSIMHQVLMDVVRGHSKDDYRQEKSLDDPKLILINMKMSLNLHLILQREALFPCQVADHLDVQHIMRMMVTIYLAELFRNRLQTIIAPRTPRT